MKRKEAFSPWEKRIQSIPTWLFIAGETSILAMIALWLETDNIHSFRDAIRVLFENAESMAIVAAVVLFFKEEPNRKAQKHYEAWQVIDNAAAAKVPTSYARIQALQDLNEDRVSLMGINLPGAHLQDINLQDARLIGADLVRANLVRANLRRADLSRTNLCRAVLIDADLHDAILNNANLSKAIVGLADLTSADLSDADCSDANFSGADFEKAFLQATNFSGADLNGVRFNEADLSGADFRQAQNLSPSQIKSARNWQFAIYDEAFQKELGLR